MQNMQQSFEGPVLAEIATFIAVAEESSFLRAAQRLGRDATLLSRRLRSLEARLGVRLLERTTRKVALTEAGRGYLLRARGILRAIDEADREAAAFATGAPHGHLRLALPSSFGRIWLAPLLAEFLAQHPQISIEAEFSNRFVDLIGERFDLAIRLGELSDSRLVARRICGRRRLLCASPAFLARTGTPTRPEDLAAYPCLIFSNLANSDRWEMTAHRVTRRVRVSGPFTSDDAEVLVEAAVSGLGIFLGTDWLVGRALRDGRLVEVLPEWRVADEGAIYVVTPSGTSMASKTRAFSDWIIARLSDPPWLEMPG